MRHRGPFGDRIPGIAPLSAADLAAGAGTSLPTIAELAPGWWFDANIGITKDGSDFVSDWANQGSAGGSFVQATGASQPLWYADNGNFNGRPSLYCDGTPKYMELLNYQGATATELFYACVYAADASPGTPGQIFTYSGGLNGPRVDSTDVSEYLGIEVNTATSDTDTHVVWAARMEPADRGTTSDFTAIGQDANGYRTNTITMPTSTSDLAFGSRVGGTANHYTGEIAEIVLWVDDTITTAGMMAVVSELMDKYGITKVYNEEL